MSLYDKDLTFFEKRAPSGELRSAAAVATMAANGFFPGVIERNDGMDDDWYNAAGGIWLVISVTETPVAASGTPVLGFSLVAGTGVSSGVISGRKVLVTIPGVVYTDWKAGYSYGVSVPIGPGADDNITHLQVRADHAIPARTTRGSFSAFLSIMPPSSARSLPGPIGRT